MSCLKIFIVFAACLNVHLLATNFTWSGGSSGSYANADNWTPNGVPFENDTVTFSNPDTIQISVPGTYVNIGWTQSADVTLTSGLVSVVVNSNPALVVTDSTLDTGGGAMVFGAASGNFNVQMNPNAESVTILLTQAQTDISGGGSVNFSIGTGSNLAIVDFDGQGQDISGQGLKNFTSPVTIGDGITCRISTPFPATITNSSTVQGEIAPSYGFRTIAQTLTGAGTGGWSIEANTIFTGTKTYQGPTEVTSGATLTLSTSLPNSAVTIDSGGTLEGTGSLGSTLAINGTCRTGSTETPGTLTVSGAVTMGANGTLTIPVTPTANGLLSIDQNVALNLSGNGTLNISYRPGVHEQSSFTVVSSQGAITGQFGSFTHNAADGVTLSLAYNATAPGSIVVTQSGRHIVHTVPLSSLRGNDRIMGDYIFEDSNFVFGSRDLVNVANAVLSESSYGFREALVRLSPLATAGTPLVTLQNNLQMAVVLDKQYQQTQAKTNIQDHQNASDPCTTPLYATPNTGFFVEPIFIFVDQRQVDGSIVNLGQVPYKAYTYGAGGGWEKVWNDCLVLELGAGYTHSNLNWSQNFGNARWSTVYLAPFMGWFNRKAYGNGMIMGAANFHWNNRVIAFPGFARQAKATYQSYDILLRFNGGFRQYLGREWWFQPDGTLNYLTVLTSAYTETGAQSIDLSVRSRQSYILQPSLRAMFIRELFRGEWYYAPKLYVGWLANVFLKRDNITGRFNGAPDQSLFTIQGYYKTINQLVLGAEMYVLKHGKFTCTTSFEADVLSKLGVYTAKVKLEWLY